MYKTITTEVGDQGVIAQYMCDLPSEFTEYNHFINNAELEPVLDALFEQGIIHEDQHRDLLKSRIIGTLYRNKVMYQTYAYYCTALEQYFVVGFTNRITRAMNPKERLFRFHSSSCVFESLKHTFVIRDAAELKNILRARGFDFKQVAVKPYTYDSRIDWCTFLVTIDGSAIGYLNDTLYIGD